MLNESVSLQYTKVFSFSILLNYKGCIFNKMISLQNHMMIHEIFYSLQGEGVWVGLPNIFIRTMGCNLRCSYCDTQEAYEQGSTMSIDEIIDKVHQYHCDHICITGGEPLLQKDLPLLLDHLQEESYQLSIETNGSQYIQPLLKYSSLLISLDIKCPSSQMHEHMDFSSITLLRKTDQLKFIIKTKEDYNYAKEILNQYKPECNCVMQPVWGMNPQTIAHWILEDQLPIRFGVQLHKILWGEKKGV